MQWYELAENPQVIAELYNEVPQLQAIDLMEVILQDGAKMTLNADLPQYPEKPPVHWVEAGYNTAYIRLEFCGLESLQITQWSTENLVDAHIEAITEGLISLKVVSPQCNIQAHAHSLKIISIRGYRCRIF